MKVWHFSISFFVLALLPKDADTCSSNGICGLQPHCYGSYPGYGSYGNGIGGGSGGGGGGGGCGGGCQSNYGCGQYGCYPSRQCGTKTFNPERIERKRKMQAAKLLAVERGEIPQKSITETENLEYASYTAALVKRFPTARLCASNGVCGGQPNCYGGGGAPGGAYGGGCGRCQTMYGCGSYGCYRMRARGSRSFQPGNGRFRAAEEGRRGESFEESEEVAFPRRTLTDIENLQVASETAALIRRNPTARLNPNKAFFECCMDRQLPDACLQKCNYGTYSRDALSRMYFKQDECPMAAMAEIQFCAAQGGDHRECCMRNGITTTLAGQKCLTFCDQRPGRVQPLDMSYIPCFDRFESMKSCFYHDLTRFRRA